MNLKPLLARIALALAASSATLITSQLAAAEHVYDISGKAYKGECTSCHIAFPPQLMSGPSWRTLMSSLDKHFGTDASLDPKAALEIGQYLEKNASTRRADPPVPLKEAPRITTSAWFVKEHREVPTAMWKSKAVGNVSNCAACHTRADQGDFSERTLRLPR